MEKQKRNLKEKSRFNPQTKDVIVIFRKENTWKEIYRGVVE